MSLTPLDRLPSTDPVPGSAVTHEAIAKRAKELWRQQGGPANCDIAIWLEAEAELIAIQQKRFRHPQLQIDPSTTPSEVS